MKCPLAGNNINLPESHNLGAHDDSRKENVFFLFSVL